MYLLACFGTGSICQGCSLTHQCFITESAQSYMLRGQFSPMDLKGAFDVEHMSSTSRIQHDLWPLDGIDPKKAKFPCCLIWTPLPVVSWLAPFIGHVGICREDGTILDFSGSNSVNVDDFTFGAAARYLQLDRQQRKESNQYCSARFGSVHNTKHSRNTMELMLMHGDNLCIIIN
ncbi:hypothetical protein NC652_017636 [Populus alba x Populus x berolinensis]|nr:hypothetical protein NC652_017636 [Populus alba x Populus x berolinensis]